MSNTTLKNKICERCSAKWSSIYDETICSNCICSDMYATLSKERKEELDGFIRKNLILQGVQKLRETLQIGLKEGMDLYSWRQQHG